jgi:hypothetical protein
MQRRVLSHSVTAKHMCDAVVAGVMARHPRCATAVLGPLNSLTAQGMCTDAVVEAVTRPQLRNASTPPQHLCQPIAFDQCL